MTVTTTVAGEHAARVPLRLSLELTLRCQARCVTCYNESGPQGTDGRMTTETWESVLGQAAELGVAAVQFIGGEPTLYQGAGGLSRLVDHALRLGLDVEVFSNLIRIPTALWPVLRRSGVSLATSYYSDTAAEHDAITRRRGSYEMTKANIRTAVEYGIPLRAGVIRVREGQRAAEARHELIHLGVDPARIGGDDVRALGRAVGDATGGDDSGPAGQLCGHCTRSRVAVLPNGEVTGCPMSRAVGSGGNVRSASLSEILSGPAWAELSAKIPAPRSLGGCTPDEDSCMPSPGIINSSCFPSHCSPNQDTCEPSSTPGTAGGRTALQLTTRREGA